ncbi:MAG: hypothetical protein RL220_1673, partial [Bacteroidota bacterium]
MRLNLWLLIVLFLITVITACEDDPLKQVNVDDTVIDYTSKRLDRDIFSADFGAPEAARQTLYHKYGEFICRYVQDILKVGRCEDSLAFRNIALFTHSGGMVRIEEAIDSLFTDEKISVYDQEFRKGLQYWHHYFPDSVVPGVVYMHSGLNYLAFATDSSIGIGLDFYLGADHPLVQEFPPDFVPNYVKEDMDDKYLVANGLRDWVYMRTLTYETGDNLLDRIIFEGKRMYLLDALMPEVADSIKMNWTVEEALWAESNEGQIWEELAKQEVLFNDNPLDIAKWTDPAPFTAA